VGILKVINGTRNWFSLGTAGSCRKKKFFEKFQGTCIFSGLASAFLRLRKFEWKVTKNEFLQNEKIFSFPPFYFYPKLCWGAHFTVVQSCELHVHVPLKLKMGLKFTFNNWSTARIRHTVYQVLKIKKMFSG